jgi:hypothetical protein
MVSVGLGPTIKSLDWVPPLTGDSSNKTIKQQKKQIQQEETRKLEATIQHSLRPDGWLMGNTPIRSLPPQGLAIDAVRQQLRGYAAKEEAKWREGFVSGTVYGGEEAIVSLMGEAATLFGLSNPLHPDLFASVMRFESEVGSMVAQLVNGGDPGVCACLTSGGACGARGLGVIFPSCRDESGELDQRPRNTVHPNLPNQTTNQKQNTHTNTKPQAPSPSSWPPRATGTTTASTRASATRTPRSWPASRRTPPSRRPRT